MYNKILKIRNIITYIVVMAIMFTYVNINGLIANAKTTENMITLFFVDNTNEKWLQNDNAVLELVDNSNGHVHYDMIKQDDCIWKAEVPENAYNITFNRYDSEKTTQWNSWSAGGREDNNAYYVDGSEYGHWETIEYVKQENYFHAGDVIYLDVSEFEEWQSDEALMYVNFSAASKEETGGYDISITSADKLLYNPENMEDMVGENVYRYVINESDEGATELRFWRGNSDFLWNYSILFTYDDFVQSGNCVKITDWDNDGYIINKYYQDKYLFSDKSEIFIGEDSEVLYFYISGIENEENEIKLYEDGVQVGIFYDDGNYSIHGDDMEGDGIYSSKYILNKDTYINEEYNYYAEFSDGTRTNNVEIRIIVPFTEKELDDMEYVDNKISEILFENETTASLLEEVLESLLNEGYIKEFEYDNINRVYNCKYSNGVMFAIIIDDFLETNTYNNENMNILYEAEAYKDYSGYSAVILNAFEDTPYRTEFYEDFVDEWKNSGMDVDYDDFVTIYDLKTKLYNRDLIALSGHGTIVASHPVFCLQDESATKDNNKIYANDIQAGRIIPVTYSNGIKSYVITGKFFSYYYGDSGLSESFVFAESCMFMGNSENGINTEFADAFLDCSAEAVIGFVNSVLAGYSRNLMLSYFESILSGNTVEDAFYYAREAYGYDDGNTAYPILSGNREATIDRGLRNGDFEASGQKNMFPPLYWKCEGDVRVQDKLGDIKAYGNYMAFLSTGIGSKSGVSLSGTQGSTMSQMVKNIDNTKLEFTYNVVSEEPMEYVGSQFDDKFEIQILDSHDNILYSEVVESVNTSIWYPISGIDFDGGDHTTYHTQWKTKSIDISEYQNELIKIKFMVYDVGDSIYDTAVIIDNINIS
ncbi:MAG: hypothetical protein K2M73_00010 [Lachnospiraceae bacterium]|nr:hypothetical protein [Lachnospiraceae bacterium]